MRDRKTERQKNKETEKWRNRETEKQRDRVTEWLSAAHGLKLIFI
jgi:hypothetical protein